MFEGFDDGRSNNSPFGWFWLWQEASRESRASFFSRLTLGWMTELLELGVERNQIMFFVCSRFPVSADSMRCAL